MPTSVNHSSYEERETLLSQIDNPQSNNNKQGGASDNNYACIKAEDKTRTKLISTMNQSL
jgi:hypothetical protein